MVYLLNQIGIYNLLLFLVKVLICNTWLCCIFALTKVYAFVTVID